MLVASEPASTNLLETAMDRAERSMTREEKPRDRLRWGAKRSRPNGCAREVVRGPYPPVAVRADMYAQPKATPGRAGCRVAHSALKISSVCSQSPAVVIAAVTFLIPSSSIANTAVHTRRDHTSQDARSHTRARKSERNCLSLLANVSSHIFG